MLEVSRFSDDILLTCLISLFFAVQFFMCFKIKNVFIRLIPTALTFAATAVLFIMIYASEGWDSIGYLVLTLYCALLLGGCAFSWLLFALIKLIKKLIKRQ